MSFKDSIHLQMFILASSHLHILSSVARVEFSSMDYMVVEGGTLTATVRVRPNGVTVATDVTVNVETVPGTATGIIL